LLAIAEQTRPIGVAGTPGHPLGGTGASGRASLKAVVVPRRIASAAKVTALETIGSIGALVTLLAAPILGIVLFGRRRRLIALRAELNAVISLESRLRTGLPCEPLRTTAATPQSEQPAPTPETPMHGYA
jgi:hypothetical protein